jgi:hypothetical protein
MGEINRFHRLIIIKLFLLVDYLATVHIFSIQGNRSKLYHPVFGRYFVVKLNILLKIYPFLLSKVEFIYQTIFNQNKSCLLNLDWQSLFTLYWAAFENLFLYFIDTKMYTSSWDVLGIFILIFYCNWFVKTYTHVYTRRSVSLNSARHLSKKIQRGPGPLSSPKWSKGVWWVT